MKEQRRDSDDIQKNLNNSKYFSLEGNIGSGKSTLLKLIQSKMSEVQIMNEPLMEWEQLGPNKNLNLLNEFYKDPKRWGYTFQSYAYYSRIKLWSESKANKPFVIAERSVLSDRYIFAENGKKQGFFNELEWVIYEDYFNWLTSKLQINKLEGIIYLKTSDECCLERINNRAREGEREGIQLSYLNQLSQRHEDWLEKNIYDRNNQIPILIIDGNSEFKNNESIQNAIIQQINDFILKQNPNKARINAQEILQQQQ